MEGHARALCRRGLPLDDRRHATTRFADKTTGDQHDSPSSASRVVESFFLLVFSFFFVFCCFFLDGRSFRSQAVREQ